MTTPKKPEPARVKPTNKAARLKLPPMEPTPDTPAPEAAAASTNQHEPGATAPNVPDTVPPHSPITRTLVSENASETTSGFTSDGRTQPTGSWHPMVGDRESNILGARKHPRQESAQMGINPRRFLRDAVKLWADAQGVKPSAAIDMLLEIALRHYAPDIIAHAYAQRAAANGYPNDWQE